VAVSLLLIVFDAAVAALVPVTFAFAITSLLSLCGLYRPFPRQIPKTTVKLDLAMGN
jgi:hypothetical protein